MLSGGNAASGDELNVEALSLATLEWTTLPALPTKVAFGYFFYDGGELILANGRYGNLLRFNPENKTFSVIPGQTMPVYATYVSAVAVTDEQLYGCA